MRALFIVPAFCLACAALSAQQPAPLGKDPGQLDAVLNGWEKTLSGLQSLQAECKRTTLDKVFNTKEIFEGKAKYLKAPGKGQASQASLELYKLTDKGPSQTIFEKYVCTGTFLYEYAPASKVIRIHDLPQGKGGQIADDNFLSFLFGMKAAEAKQRYELALSPPPDNTYYYIHIRPKLPQDKADFALAQLILIKTSLLPRRVWFSQPNGNETTWDFMPQQNVPLSPKTFEQPALPAGWKFERVPGQAPPKVRGTGP